MRTNSVAKIKELLHIPVPFKPFKLSREEQKSVISTGSSVLTRQTNIYNFDCFYQGGSKNLIFGLCPVHRNGDVYFEILILKEKGTKFSQLDVKLFISFLKS